MEQKIDCFSSRHGIKTQNLRVLSLPLISHNQNRFCGVRMRTQLTEVNACCFRLVVEVPDEAVGAGDGKRTPLTPSRSVPVYSGQKAMQSNIRYQTKTQAA